MKAVIGRADLRVRIIDMGLGVEGLRLGHPGWGTGFHLPQSQVLENSSGCKMEDTNPSLFTFLR